MRHLRPYPISSAFGERLEVHALKKHLDHHRILGTPIVRRVFVAVLFRFVFADDGLETGAISELEQIILAGAYQEGTRWPVSSRDRHAIGVLPESRHCKAWLQAKPKTNLLA